jgi:penicillin-binding protein 1B
MSYLSRLLSPRVLAGLLVLLPIAAPRPAGASLETTLGRNESRIYAAPFAIPAGARVAELALPERLERLGYERVHARPTKPGEYFHGTEVFWIYRRPCHARGDDRRAELFGLALDPRSGAIVGVKRADGGTKEIRDEEDAWLEPELLAESIRGERADRLLVDLDALPEPVWRAVLAAEDARFFDHPGVDARAVARAALKNLKKGRIAEGGSTITQQLVKNRALTPERSLGRKASEAMLALALESGYEKKEILTAYLNAVYLGNIDGLAIHGIGAAARTYFSKPAAKLSLAEAAAIAAMIQGPNRMSPAGAPAETAALRARRDWVLGRMVELGWAKEADVARARAQGVGAKPSPPRSSTPRPFVAWVALQVAQASPSRYVDGWGFLVETTLDPWLQRLAEESVREGLQALRKSHPTLRRERLEAALVALDARTGEVVAYVGGDPGSHDRGLDRARTARRQPGSVVKPFVALEALDRCGGKAPLTASSRIDDAPLEIELETGPTKRWTPVNFDQRFVGPVLLREALAESRNIPAVRIARWCGFDATALTFARAGFELPADPPPSFVLGAIESSPLAVAGAYTVFATPGRALEPYPVRRIETSKGLGVDRRSPHWRRVSSAAAAYLVRDLLRTAVEEGTASAGEIRGVDVAGKTGTSSERRDAWFAGHAGSLVTAVWVGLDDGSRLGLTGGEAAGPLWRRFMVGAVPARAPYEVERPENIVERWVELGTGLLVREGRAGARPELYRRGTLPERRRWWKIDEPMPVIE